MDFRRLHEGTFTRPSPQPLTHSTLEIPEQYNDLKSARSRKAMGQVDASGFPVVTDLRAGILAVIFENVQDVSEDHVEILHPRPPRRHLALPSRPRADEDLHLHAISHQAGELSKQCLPPMQPIIGRKPHRPGKYTRDAGVMICAQLVGFNEVADQRCLVDLRDVVEGPTRLAERGHGFFVEVE